jgi:hypothetical protein
MKRVGTGIKRLMVVTVAALGVLAPAGALAAATGSGSASASGPRTEVKDLVCIRALDPPARAMNVEVVMRPLTGTQRMAMRVQLLQKLAGAATFTPLQGSGLGVWQYPTDPPTLGQNPNDRWVAYHPVAELPAPATYRYEVQFRWIGDHDRTLGSATRYSKSCFQPELRPDLTVNSITVTPVQSHPKLDQYAVVIGNLGRTGAGPFDVQFTDQAITKDKTVQHIGPHTTKTIEFAGPLCNSATPPSVTVDPEDQIDVYSRANATLVATCPAPSGASGSA